MNEHPILFSRKMVRAILVGKKSQTRRIVKGTALDWLQPNMFSQKYVALPENYLSPYGYAGNLLWVRETFAQYPDGFVYKADFADDGFGSGVVNLQTGENYPLVWKPSIHMPRKASRLTLEITELRIERLNDISESDATAEGCQAWVENGQVTDTAVSDYAHLWNEINLERGYSWESNPFVWVVSFQIARGLTPRAPDSLKAGVLSLPEAVKVENALPAVSG